MALDFITRVDPASFTTNGIPLYKPETYGALGDLSNDDTAAIQAAIDASIPGSWIFLSPAKHYKITDTLVFSALSSRRFGGLVSPLIDDTPSLHWYGAGDGTMIERTNCDHVDFMYFNMWLYKNQSYYDVTPHDGAAIGIDTDGTGGAHTSTQSKIVGVNIFAADNPDFVGARFANTSASNNEFMDVIDCKVYGGVGAEHIADYGRLGYTVDVTSGSTAALMVGATPANFLNTNSAWPYIGLGFSLVGQRVRIMGAGTAGAMLDTTVAAVNADGVHFTLGTNALATLSGARIFIGESVGAGFQIGGSGGGSNAFNYHLKSITVSNLAVGFNNISGTAEVDDVRGGNNELDVFYGIAGQDSVIANINTEHSRQQIHLGSNAAASITIRNIRGANDCNAESFFRIESTAKARILFQNNEIQNVPPAGCKIFDFTSADCVFDFEGTRWPDAGINNSTDLARTGLSTIPESCLVTMKGNQKFLVQPVTSGYLPAGSPLDMADAQYTTAPWIIDVKSQNNAGGGTGSTGYSGLTVTVQVPTGAGSSETVAVKGVVGRYRPASSYGPMAEENVGLSGEFADSAAANGSNPKLTAVLARWVGTIGGNNSAKMYGFRLVPPTSVTNGPANMYGLYLPAITQSGLVGFGVYQDGASDLNWMKGLFAQGEGAVLTISSNTIAPTNSIHHVGAGLIKTITVPTGFTSGEIKLIPDSAFTYDATGNIIGTGTAVVGRIMTATYSSSSSKWYMSY